MKTPEYLPENFKRIWTYFLKQLEKYGTAKKAYLKGIKEMPPELREQAKKIFLIVEGIEAKIDEISKSFEKLKPKQKKKKKMKERLAMVWQFFYLKAFNPLYWAYFVVMDLPYYATLGPIIAIEKAKKNGDLKKWIKNADKRMLEQVKLLGEAIKKFGNETEKYIQKYAVLMEMKKMQ